MPPREALQKKGAEDVSLGRIVAAALLKSDQVKAVLESMNLGSDCDWLLAELHQCINVIADKLKRKAKLQPLNVDYGSLDSCIDKEGRIQLDSPSASILARRKHRHGV